MRNSPLKDVFQAQVVAPRVDGVNIIGNVFNGEILQVDRGRHDGIFSIPFARTLELVRVCTIDGEEQKSEKSIEGV